MSSAEAKAYKMLNTTSCVFNTYGSSGSATYLPRIAVGSIKATTADRRLMKKSISMSWTHPHKESLGNLGGQAALLYKTTNQQLGHFYATSTEKLLTPNVAEMRASQFSKSFNSSGMFQDTSLSSPQLQKMRRKYHREYVRKRAIEKEAFLLRQQVAELEKKERRAKERERKYQKFMARESSATTIQCMYRSFVARRETEYRRTKHKHAAAARMQRMFVNMLACRDAIFEKRRRRNRKAAVKIQCIARKKQAKKIVKQKFQDRDAERERMRIKYEYDCATDIQRVYRGFVDRRRVSAKLEQRAKFKKMNGGKGRPKRKKR